MAESINRIASVWLNWQWAMLWQTAVVIGLVAVADRLIRNRAWPQLRYALWLLVLVKLVLPPGLVSPMSVTSRIPALTQKAMEAGVQPQPRSFEPGMVQIRTDAVAVDPPQTERPARVAPVPAATHSGLSWVVYAMGVWLAGVVVLAAGLYIRLRQLSREHSAPQREDAPAWFDELLTQTADEIGLRRVPQVIFSPRVSCPAVFGAFKSVVLFPADSPAMTRQETRHVLLHELAHIKRGDLLMHAAYMILATIYWFNPLLWLIRKHVQNLRELCCDATVARHLKEETAAYRETLLATGRALLAQPVDPGLGLLGLFENSGWLPVRLHWLQKKTWKHPWLRRTLVAAVVALMLACVLPMAAAKEDAPGQFKVTLSNGVTLELVGIRKPGTSQWWRPDGSPLADAPYDSCVEDMHLTNPPYEFALRYENLPNDARGGMGIEPSRGSWGGSIPEPAESYRLQKAGKPVEGMTYIIAGEAAETETVTVSMHLATGDWTTEDPQNLHHRSADGWDSDTRFSPTLDAMVAIAAPYEREGTTHGTMFYSMDDPSKQKYDVRLTALDINNVDHPPAFQNGGWSSNGGKTLASSWSEFALPLEDIAALNLQVRPRTRVEFKNVSLRPGNRQRVETLTTEASRPVIAKKQGTSPEGFADVRDYSSQVLQAFYKTCVRYLNDHQGSELPPRPWLLKFRFPNPILVDGRYQNVGVVWLQYVTCVGYFRPNGFQSLRREDFKSSEAGHTPILYCKTLLEAENGKGTNVLFGDGHIEWLTIEKLNSLNPADKPGQGRD